MTTESDGVENTAPRGVKRRSNSPPPWRRSQKAQRTSYASRDGPNRQESAATFEKLQKDQVRLNQIQEDERAREWVAQEDEFVLKQAKKKAEIRVKDGRAKPIDWLTVVLRSIDTTRNALDDEYDTSEIDIVDPNTVFDKLSEEQLLDLEKDIDTFLRLEKNTQNKDYWRTMRIICRDRRKKSTVDPEGRAVSSVSSDIDLLLSPKSFDELEALEVQINRKLVSDEPIDTDYWEQLLKSLLTWKAKAKLEKLYQSALDSRSSALVRQTGATTVHVGKRQERPNKGTDSGSVIFPITGDAMRKPEQKPTTAETDAARAGLVLSEPSSGRFAAIPTEDFSQATKALYEKEVARGISENEEIFAGEEDVDTKSKALWSGKYRPRKPRYFNRVQMGYEWNKYNQTHYDHDNPPPKVVQGYKFNIFYPDLIDKTKAPTYKIEREGGRKKGQSFAPAGEEDTCLIRFISGPPYEDVAFRIVDKEWDYSAKRERGFKSSFDKGILQLHFQFKKVFYRK
ncbi:hypothetical protein EPUS_02978 [Endocarpon pusillum Z07020]|uniref:Splicing factor Cactin n=1 Tax=Endocarpon pusillum (strain Z07020 / HMAS-L-300199) TaxID=1263415 RepID=U1G4G4_ENDPU|nr:uncharacterized protein EPUS_02978 [Endocarpon pusillum Z07020]ERF72187.1 hypothetical protein EPUS_02978 [Endocarpon pusillum Z07020]